MEKLPRPDWLVAKSAPEDKLIKIRGPLNRFRLNTVCEAARCPNLFECWQDREVTIMVLGDVCTRSCRFCATASGDPAGKVDRKEPERVMEFVRETGLDYLVITSVTRDDLADGGAGHFSSVISKVREIAKGIKIEVLAPDFSGRPDSVKMLLDAGPDVFGHNIETVSRLSSVVRDRRASYETSLKVLEIAKQHRPQTAAKSSLMLGLGEKRNEVLEAMRDLRDRGVDILTLGQYLSPGANCLPVARFVPPAEFKGLENEGYKMGFKSVMAGPLVRSSYHAKKCWQNVK
jgi:lipoyl synthase